MKKPALVILAAGMGSRYGGLKQMDPMDPMGHAIIDYSIYDAKRAGFGKVVFVIKKAIEKDFKETIGARVPEGMEVCYAYQEVDALPKGYNVPEGRVKPWGTAHAVLCAKPFINEPFSNSSMIIGWNPKKFIDTKVSNGSDVQVAPSSSVNSA